MITNIKNGSFTPNTWGEKYFVFDDDFTLVGKKYKDDFPDWFESKNPIVELFLQKRYSAIIINNKEIYVMKNNLYYYGIIETDKLNKLIEKDVVPQIIDICFNDEFLKLSKD